MDKKSYYCCYYFASHGIMQNDNLAYEKYKNLWIWFALCGENGENSVESIESALETIKTQ